MAKYITYYSSDTFITSRESMEPALKPNNLQKGESSSLVSFAMSRQGSDEEKNATTHCARAKSEYLKGAVPNFSVSARTLLAFLLVLGLGVLCLIFPGALSFLISLVPITRMETQSVDIEDDQYSIQARLINVPMYTLLVYGVGCVAFSCAVFSFHKCHVSSQLAPLRGPEFASVTSWRILIPTVLFTVIIPLVMDVASTGMADFYTLRGILLLPFGLCLGVYVDIKSRGKRGKKLMKKIMTSTQMRPSLLQFMDRQMSRKLKSMRKKGILSSSVDVLIKSPAETLCILLYFTYAIFLVPMFVSWTDAGRLAFVCIFHNGVTEIISSLNRKNTIRSIRAFTKDSASDADEDCVVQNAGVGVSKFKWAEFFFAFSRRCMISTMKDVKSCTIAITITSVQELILRSTTVIRDQHALRKCESYVRFKRDANKNIYENAKCRVWAVAIFNGMVCELAAILLRVLTAQSLQDMKGIFVVGTLADWSNPLSLLHFNVALEALSEVFVQLVAVRILMESVNVDDAYSHFRTIFHFNCAVSSVVMGYVFSLVIFTVSPNFMWCGDPVDVCSCSRTLFPHFLHTCNITNIAAANSSIDDDGDEEGGKDGSSLAFILGLTACLTLLAVAVAVYSILRTKKQIKIASELQTTLFKTQMQLDTLSKKMTFNEQTRVQEELEKKEYAPLEAYRVEHSHLRLEKMIGEGAVGEVWKGTYRKQNLVAVKKILWGTDFSNALTCFRAEALIMAEMQSDGGVSHPNLVQMRHVCWEKELLIVFDYYKLGALDDLMKKVCVSEVQIDDFVWVHEADEYGSKERAGVLLNIATDVASGSAFMHSFDPPVLHRDLKPSNVLIEGDWTQSPDEWAGRIADFGESAKLDLENTMTMKGSPFYMAPEVILCSPYDQTADIYSFGMVLLAMATFDSGGLQACWSQSPQRNSI